MDLYANLDRVLDLIYQHSIQREDANGQQLEWRYRRPIDWPAWREAAQDDMKSVAAPEMVDLMATTDRALCRLGTYHSFVFAFPEYGRGYYLPPHLPMSIDSADKILSEPWPVLKQYRQSSPQSVEGKTSAPSIDPQEEMPQVHALADGQVAYAIMPGHSINPTDHGPTRAYEQILRDGLMQAATRQLKAVIIDLRGNGGGSCIPMLRGMSPLMGDGVLGHFIAPGGISPWHVDHGYNAFNPAARPYRDNPENFPLKDIPVAVLVGEGTGSSGEITCLSYVNRPNTILIGQPTYGSTTTNTAYQPFEQRPFAQVALTEALMTDRTGVHGRGDRVHPALLSENPVADALQWLAETCSVQTDFNRLSQTIHQVWETSPGFKRRLAWEQYKREQSRALAI